MPNEVKIQLINEAINRLIASPDSVQNTEDLILLLNKKLEYLR